MSFCAVPPVFPCVSLYSPFLSHPGWEHICFIKCSTEEERQVPLWVQQGGGSTGLSLCVPPSPARGMLTSCLGISPLLLTGEGRMLQSCSLIPSVGWGEGLERAETMTLGTSCLCWLLCSLFADQNLHVCEWMGYLPYALLGLAILFQDYFLFPLATKPKSFSSWNFLRAATICVSILISGANCPIIHQCIHQCEDLDFVSILL